MQWNTAANAGFCPPTVAPWLPIADDYRTYNVEAEQHDPRSFLSLTRSLLEQRRKLTTLTLGSYRSLELENEVCIAYLRQYENQSSLIALNISAHEQMIALSQLGQGRIILSTYMDREDTLDLSTIHLRPNEGLLIEIEQ